MPNEATQTQGGDAAHSLFEAMTAVAEERCSAILDKAKTEAETMLEEARTEAEGLETEAVALAREQCEEQAAREQERTKTGIERERNALRHGLIDEVMNEVRVRLDAIANGPDFAPVLDALLSGALSSVKREGRDDGVLYSPAAWVAHCRDWLSEKGHEGLEVRESGEIDDGIALELNGGEVRIVNTLSARLAEAGERARTAVARVILSEGRE